MVSTSFRRWKEVWVSDTTECVVVVATEVETTIVVDRVAREETTATESIGCRVDSHSRSNGPM